MSMNENTITVTPGTITYEQMNIFINYQKLWSQLAMWMRDFIYSNFEDSGNLQIITTQLFDKLPLTFYNAFKIFYGTEISRQFLSAFLRFLDSAIQLVHAYKNNDTSAIDSSTSQWYENADALATFFATINIYWSKDQWRNLLYQYIKLIIQEINAIKNGEYENEINIYNNINNLTDLMGSYMARGIISKNVG